MIESSGCPQWRQISISENRLDLKEKEKKCQQTSTAKLCSQGGDHGLGPKVRFSQGIAFRPFVHRRHHNHRRASQGKTHTWECQMWPLIRQIIMFIPHRRAFALKELPQLKSMEMHSFLYIYIYILYILRLDNGTLHARMRFRECATWLPSWLWHLLTGWSWEVTALHYISLFIYLLYISQLGEILSHRGHQTMPGTLLVVTAGEGSQVYYWL